MKAGMTGAEHSIGRGKMARFSWEALPARCDRYDVSVGPIKRLLPSDPRHCS